MPFPLETFVIMLSERIVYSKWFSFLFHNFVENGLKINQNRQKQNRLKPHQRSSDQNENLLEYLQYERKKMNMNMLISDDQSSIIPKK